MVDWWVEKTAAEKVSMKASWSAAEWVEMMVGERVCSKAAC